jgi:hypothetical protein
VGAACVLAGHRFVEGSVGSLAGVQHGLQISQHVFGEAAADVPDIAQ